MATIDELLNEKEDKEEKPPWTEVHAQYAALPD